MGSGASKSRPVMVDQATQTVTSPTSQERPLATQPETRTRSMPSIRSNKEDFYKDDVQGSVQMNSSIDMEQSLASTQQAFDTSAESMQQVSVEQRDVVVAHHAEQDSTVDKLAAEVTSANDSPEAEVNELTPEIEVVSSPVEQRKQDQAEVGENEATVRLEKAMEGKSVSQEEVRELEDGQIHSASDKMNAEEPKTDATKIGESENTEEIEDSEANESINHSTSSGESDLAGMKEGENVNAHEGQNAAQNQSTNNSVATDNLGADEEKAENIVIAEESEDNEQRACIFHLTNAEELISTDGAPNEPAEPSLNVTYTDTERDKNEPDGQSEQGEEQAKHEPTTSAEGEVKDQHTATQEENDGKHDNNTVTEGAGVVATAHKPEDELQDDYMGEKLDDILEGLLRDTAIVDDDKGKNIYQRLHVEQPTKHLTFYGRECF
ncbi:uncharacterized protein LOC144878206 [Branchiostoma floridae x Branchiostoma japonicum]